MKQANSFSRIVSKKTDEELIQMLTKDRHTYLDKALRAASLEIRKRKIDTSGILHIEQYLKLETEAENMKSGSSNPIKRFFSLIIPS